MDKAAKVKKWRTRTRRDADRAERAAARAEAAASRLIELLEDTEEARAGEPAGIEDKRPPVYTRPRTG